MKLMEHNQKAVDEIINSYNKGIQKIIYTSGVGTGKSFVFMGVAEQLKGKILYIIPKYAIVDNLKSYKEFEELKDRVDFKTYNYFSNTEKYGILADYSLLVIDEVHHLGSDLYGNNLLEAINQSGIKTLGLTATPVRMKDSLNVETLFDKTVQGLTNFEAISKGLMPQVEYLVCSPDTNDIAKGTRKVVDWFGSYGLLKETIDNNPKAKWICFCTDIRQLSEVKPMIRELFPDKEVLEIHSKKNNCSEVLKYADSLDECIMLNCDMLLEGLHFSGVDGIIIFREVHSIPTFEQIIGRVLSMNKKENPLVIDCTDTWKRMYGYIEVEKENKDRKEYKKHGPSVKRKPCFVSLKNKEYYSYMELLKKRYEASYNQNKPIIFNNVMYPSVAECCRELSIPYYSILRLASVHNISHEEAIKRYLKLGFIYNGEAYRSVKECCEKHGISYSTVQQKKKREGITYEESVAECIAGFGFNYKGVNYPSLKQCCEALGVDYKAVLHLQKKGYSKLDAIEMLLDKPMFEYKDNKYDSISDCLRKLGLSKSAYDYRRAKGMSIIETLDALMLARA